MWNKNKRFVLTFIVGIVLLFDSGCGSTPKDSETAIFEEVPEELPEEQVEPVIIPQREYILYAAVPIEYMSMRTAPGLENDVVAQIYPGTLLKGDGEIYTVNNLDFYKVSTLDGSCEGYCTVNYCIEVSFEYEESILNLVDTSDAMYTYEKMENDLKEISDQYADYVTLIMIGESAEGRNLYCAILGNPDATTKIMVQAGIHGREYMSTQQVMKMLEYYAAFHETGYYQDKLYSEIFSDIAYYIIPMSNPDGISISQFGEAAVSSEERIMMMRHAYERDKETLIYKTDPDGNLYWYDTYKDGDFDRYKKGYDQIITYEEYLTLWKANANGVDINRNFNAGWEDIQQKDEPGCEFFKGYISDSEPETLALQKIITEYSFAYIINYHSRGQLIYYDAEGNTDEMSQKSFDLASQISSLNRHQLVNSKDPSNVVLGGLGDWAMLKKNTPSVTIEMGKRPCPLGREEFQPIWIRNREVWASLAANS